MTTIAKPWLDHYPSYVPQTIDEQTYPSLTALMQECLLKYRDLPALSNMGTVLTYAELNHYSRKFAAYLLHECKLQKGDRIAIMMPNLLQYPIALLGALRAGLVVVNTNPLYSPRELEHQLCDSGAKAIVIVENFAHVLQQVVDKTAVKHIITTEVGDMAGFRKALLINFIVRRVKKMVPPFELPQAVKWSQVLQVGKTHLDYYNDTYLESDDIAFLQYTGGTTGVSKGAVLSHGNMVANILQATAWTQHALEEGKEVFITALPLYHIFALTANMFMALRYGAHSVLVTNPRDVSIFLKDLARQPFTFITGVNTLFALLLNSPGAEKIDFSQLKISLGGGMAVQKDVAERWKALTGCVLLEAYGLTETSPAVTINPPDLQEYNGMIGLPLPSTDVTVRNSEGEALTVGEVGELCVKGPQVMQSYWNRPEETAKVLDAQGWLHTGDMAFMDEQGFVKLVDRLKDMILVSGFNVYPNEVEDVLVLHPDVLEAGVIGKEDEHSGEVVQAFVVTKQPDLSAAMLQDWCHEHLTGYKCPKQVIFVDELPKSNVGKVLRKNLREIEVAHESG